MDLRNAARHFVTKESDIMDAVAPMGGDLEFADELTLGRALSGRRTL